MVAGLMELADGDGDDYFDIGSAEAQVYANSDTKIEDVNDIGGIKEWGKLDEALEVGGDPYHRTGAIVLTGMRHRQIGLPTGRLTFRNANFGLSYSEPVPDPVGGGWMMAPRGVNPNTFPN